MIFSSKQASDYLIYDFANSNARRRNSFNFLEEDEVSLWYLVFTPTTIYS